MEKLTLKIKEPGKLNFLLELLNQFDFVEVQKPAKDAKANAGHDFFASSGLWSGRDIDADSLRSEAWKKGA